MEVMEPDALAALAVASVASTSVASGASDLASQGDPDDVVHQRTLDICNRWIRRDFKINRFELWTRGVDSDLSLILFHFFFI